MRKIKPLEQKTFMADVDEGDVVRFICESGREKVGFLVEKSHSNHDLFYFSRDYSSQQYAKARFSLLLRIGRCNRIKYNQIKGVGTEQESRETATHYQVLYKRKGD